MNDIQGKIKSFLEKYKLDCPDKIFLVAFSGGYDSMCLIDVLSKTCSNKKIVAIHLNHCWRGKKATPKKKIAGYFVQNTGLNFIASI